MMRKPQRESGLIPEEKKKVVLNLQNRIAEYNSNIDVLYSDLNHLTAVRKWENSRSGNILGGIFDPEASGYDLYAENPVEQATQLLLFDYGLDSNTGSLLIAYKFQRIGDVLNAFRKGNLDGIPGLGPKRKENIKASIGKMGMPTDWIN